MFTDFVPAMTQLNSAGARIRFYLPEIFGSTVSTSGAIAAWQEQAQWTISMLAAFVGLVAGLLTIRSLIKKEKSLK